MTVKKFIHGFLVTVFVFLLPLILLLTTLQISAFDRAYYQMEYIKYQVPRSIGIEMPELLDATEKLLLYLENKRQDIDFKATIKGEQVEFFSQRDKLHMVDVKELFVKGRILRNLSLVYIHLFFIYLFKYHKGGKKALAKYNVYSFAAGTLPFILLAVLMYIDFYKYFTIFHEIFFSNDLWLLDPTQDRLVNVFPQDFFSDMAFRTVYRYIAVLGGIFVLSAGYLIYGRKKQINHGKQGVLYKSR